MTLPEMMRHWERLTSQQSLDNAGLPDDGQDLPDSEIPFPLFLTFRAIWPDTEGPDDFRDYISNEQLVGHDAMKESRCYLDQYPDWNTYKASFSQANTTPIPTPTPGTSGVAEERVVILALILFLQAISVHFNRFVGKWMLIRLPLVLERLGGDGTVFETKAYGYLDFPDDDGPVAVLDVAPQLRSSGAERKTDILIRQTAQMVAWIANHPPAPNGKQHRRLLVSQHKHEIFINIGHFDDAYVSYLRGGSYPSTFLEMKSFGPFEVQNIEHLTTVAEFILGFQIDRSQGVQPNQDVHWD